MMDLKDRIFQLFVEANGLSVARVFGKGKLYEGLGEEPRSSETLMETLEFAAFCDGYDAKPHRYKGPRGSPDADHIEVLTKQIASGQSGLSITRIEIGPDDLVRERGVGVTPELEQKAMEDMQRIVESDPRKRYDIQYRLGMNMHGR